jgi:hypothetical protein
MFGYRLDVIKVMASAVEVQFIERVFTALTEGKEIF